MSHWRKLISTPNWKAVFCHIANVCMQLCSSVETNKYSPSSLSAVWSLGLHMPIMMICLMACRKIFLLYTCLNSFSVAYSHLTCQYSQHVWCHTVFIEMKRERSAQTWRHYLSQNNQVSVINSVFHRSLICLQLDDPCIWQLWTCSQIVIIDILEVSSCLACCAEG